MAVRIDVWGSRDCSLSQSLASRNGTWRVRKAGGVDTFGGTLVCGEDSFEREENPLYPFLLSCLHMEHLCNWYLTKH